MGRWKKYMGVCYQIMILGFFFLFGDDFDESAVPVRRL